MKVGELSSDESAEFARLLLQGEPGIAVGHRGSSLDDLVDFFVRWSLTTTRVETLLLRGDVGTGKTRLARLLWFYRAYCRAGKPARAAVKDQLVAAYKAERDLGQAIRDPKVVGELSKIYGWREQPLPNVVDTLFDALLFGHEKGAFTGAVGTLPGALTWSESPKPVVPKDVFLDEVTEIGENSQVKLLGLLSTGVFRAVGGQSEQKLVDRLVFATNRDLETFVANGRFRRDLHHRIASPCLRLRGLDEYSEAEFASVVRVLTTEWSQALGVTEMLQVRPSEIEELRRMKWPGNIRQLEKVIDDFVRSAAAGKVGRRPMQVAEETAEFFALKQHADSAPVGSAEDFFDEELERAKASKETLTPKKLYARYVARVVPNDSTAAAFRECYKRLSKADLHYMNQKEWQKHR